MKKLIHCLAIIFSIFFCTSILADSGQTIANNKMLTDNKMVVKNFYTDVWTHGNRNAVYKYVARSATGSINGNSYDLAGLMERLIHFDSINTNISANIKQLIAEGDKVAVYVSICSTTKVDEKRFCIPNLGFYTIKSGKITHFITTSPVPSIYKFKPQADE